MKRTLIVMLALTIMLAVMLGCIGGMQRTEAEHENSADTEAEDTSVSVPEEKKCEIVKTVPLSYSAVDDPIQPPPSAEVKSSSRVDVPAGIFGTSSEVLKEIYSLPGDEYSETFYRFSKADSSETFMTIRGSCEFICRDNGETAIVNTSTDGRVYIYSCVNGVISRACLNDDIVPSIPEGSYNICFDSVSGEEHGISVRYLYPGETEGAYYDCCFLGTLKENSIDICYLSETLTDPYRAFLSSTDDWSIDITVGGGEVQGLTLECTDGRAFYLPSGELCGDGYRVSSKIHKGTERTLLIHPTKNYALLILGITGQSIDELQCSVAIVVSLENGEIVQKKFCPSYIAEFMIEEGSVTYDELQVCLGKEDHGFSENMLYQFAEITEKGFDIKTSLLRISDGAVVYGKVFRQSVVFLW